LPVNNIWIEYSDRIVSRYKRTCVNAVSGIRLHPNTNDRISFVLNSNWDDFDKLTETVKFRYDNDIIEIYSEQEDKVFRLINAYLFQNGYLAPYGGSKEVVSTANSLSDEALADIAGAKSITVFEEHVKELTSLVTLTRLLEAVKSADRPYSFINIVEKRIKEI